MLCPASPPRIYSEVLPSCVAATPGVYCKSLSTSTAPPKRGTPFSASIFIEILPLASGSESICWRAVITTSSTLMCIAVLSCCPRAILAIASNTISKVRCRRCVIEKKVGWQTKQPPQLFLERFYKYKPLIANDLICYFIDSFTYCRSALPSAPIYQ